MIHSAGPWQPTDAGCECLGHDVMRVVMRVEVIQSQQMPQAALPDSQGGDGGHADLR